MPRKALLLSLALFAVPNQLVAQEPVAKSKIISAGIFKNGLTVVKREVQVPEAGTYRLDVAPEPVHGTFWVESNCRVDTAVKMREFDVPFHSGAQGNLQEELAGKKVTIHLKDGKLPAVIGTVASMKKPKEKSREGDAELEVRGHVYAMGFLILKTAKGHTYVNPGEIAAVEVEGVEDTVKQRRPALVLTVEKSDKKPTIFISYLTHGLGWAPSYLVDISDAKSMSMAAVIRNELADLDNAHVKLISGFPSVQFAHVTSPLAPRTSWDKFMATLTRPPGDMQSAMLTQNTVNFSNTHFVSSRMRDLGATPAGEGVDLHFEDIGKRSLQDGETMSLSMAKAKAAYERVVEWAVSNKNRRTEDSETSTEEIWDVLHFKNPFSFPITTGPAMVEEKGQFNGQRSLYWANVGEETFLRITRSLSVRARSLEREEKVKNVADLEIVRIGSRDYRRVAISGELSVSNHRKQPVKMMIRRTVDGTLLTTEGSPKILPREDRLHAVNSTQELVWTLNLEPGEEKSLHYRYTLLVAH